MIKHIYAIYDTIAEQLFGPLMVLPNHAVARRTFQDALFGEGSNLASHPKDYVLIYIGSLNLDSGHITPSSPEPTKTDRMIAGDVLVELATRTPADA